MSNRKTEGGWREATPSPTRPKLRAKINPGVTADSPAGTHRSAGVAQRPATLESVRPSQTLWCEVAHA